MLIVQLAKPTLDLSTLTFVPIPEAQSVLSSALPVLLEASLNTLGQPGAMEANPDIVQAFFGCMDTLARDFVDAFYRLPPGAFDGLMQCAIESLALQERYSLVSACTFLVTLINRTFLNDDLHDAQRALVQVHGRPLMRAILCGFAGTAPRSVTPNLIELLPTLLTRHPADSRSWISDIMFADDFIPSKAGPEAKEKFVKAVSSARSMKRMRDAAQQFALVARGLEGSSFGYASVSV